MAKDAHADGRSLLRQRRPYKTFSSAWPSCGSIPPVQELYDGLPLNAAQAPMVDPAEGNFSKAVFTAGTSVSAISQFVSFSELTAGGNSMSRYQVFFR